MPFFVGVEVCFPREHLNEVEFWRFLYSLLIGLHLPLNAHLFIIIMSGMYMYTIFMYMQHAKI